MVTGDASLKSVSCLMSHVRIISSPKIPCSEIVLTPARLIGVVDARSITAVEWKLVFRVIHGITSPEQRPTKMMMAFNAPLRLPFLESLSAGRC